MFEWRCLGDLVGVFGGFCGGVWEILWGCLGDSDGGVWGCLGDSDGGVWGCLGDSDGGVWGFVQGFFADLFVG